jgi:hypothetical protein
MAIIFQIDQYRKPKSPPDLRSHFEKSLNFFYQQDALKLVYSENARNDFLDKSRIILLEKVPRQSADYAALEEGVNMALSMILKSLDFWREIDVPPFHIQKNWPELIEEPVKQLRKLSDSLSIRSLEIT